MDRKMELSHLDVMAIIGFDAQRIVKLVDAAAAGFVPHPSAIQDVIDHMQTMNKTLIDSMVVPTAQMQAKAAMGVELT
jgi:hypothetical protein